MFFLQRRLLIRASLFCNFCVLTYVALQAAQGGGSHGGHGAASGQAGSAAGLADTFLPSGVHITYNGEPETASTGTQSSPSISTHLSGAHRSVDTRLGDRSNTNTFTRIRRDKGNLTIRNTSRKSFEIATPLRRESCLERNLLRIAHRFR